MTPPSRAPSASELLNDPVVQAALEAAWLDSKADDLSQRHEEGGWMYLDLITGQLTIERASVGNRAGIDLDHPPLLQGSVVVGVFHTHPNPAAEGWDPRPSRNDQYLDALNGVPDLI